MINQSQYNMLINNDSGSCRDITFSDLSVDQLKRTLQWLTETYQNFEVTASKNETEHTINFRDFFTDNYSAMYGKVNSDKQIINNIQFYIFGNPDGSFFLELTFFPENIRQQSDSLEELNKWLEKMFDQIQADSFYVRYENASWVFGDVSPNSGVIFSKIQANSK